MENNPPVPVKTKIAARLLIGLGVGVALATLLFVFIMFTELLNQGGNDNAGMIAETIAFQAIAIALATFISGLFIFKKKKKILILAVLIFFMSYGILFTTWKLSASPLIQEMSSLGCDFNSCAMNNLAADNFTEGSNIMFALTTLPIYLALLSLSLILSGIKIMRFSKKWWILGIILMSLSVLSQGSLISAGMASLMIEYPGFIFSALLTGFSLIVIILLLLDAEEFFAGKSAE